MRFVRLVLGVILLPLFLAFGYEAIGILLDEAADQTRWLVAGFLVYILFYLLMRLLRLGRAVTFVEVFEHELVHAATALVFFRPVRSISVSAEGGLTQLGRPVGCLSGLFFFLSPYFVPLVTIPLLFAYLFVPSQYVPLLNFLVGFTLGFHTMSLLFHELHIGQTDFRMAGLPWTIGFIVFFNSLIAVTAVALASDDPAMISTYIQNSLATARLFYQAILQLVQNLAS